MSFDKNLIAESFEAIKPISEDVVNYFYDTLFSNHPEALPLFKNVDMQAQKKALLNSLAHCVENINDEQHVQKFLRSLGERHLRYGVEEEHYAWVGEALLETLKYFFDENWTTEAEAAWAGLYDFMSKQMIAGMNENRPAFEIVSENIRNQPLSDIIKGHVKTLFVKALNEELNGELMDLAREKVREVLRTTLEREIASEIRSWEDKESSVRVNRNGNGASNGARSA